MKMSKMTSSALAKRVLQAKEISGIRIEAF